MSDRHPDQASDLVLFVDSGQALGRGSNSTIHTAVRAALALLLALLIYKVWDLAYRVQVDDWFEYWRGRIVRLKLAPPAKRTLCLSPAWAVLRG